MNPLQFLKKAPWRKIALGLVFLIVLLVTLLVLAGTWFSYQGRREWAQTKTELLSRGEVLSLEEFIPPPLPPEQNFFADPIWEPNAEGKIELFDMQMSAEEAAALRKQFPSLAESIKEGKRADVGRVINRRALSRSYTPEEAALVLATYEPMKSDFSTLHRLALRSAARFPLSYEKGTAMLLPHLNALMKSGQMLAMMARAKAVLKQEEDSGADEVLLILRLPQTVDDDVTLISYLVKLSLYSIALSVIETSVSDWNAAQVGEVQQAVAKADILRQTIKTLRGERAFGNQIMDQLKQAPLGEFTKTLRAASGVSESGDQAPLSIELLAEAYRFAFFDGDRAFLNQTYQKWLDYLSSEPGQVTPARLEALNANIDESLRGVNRYRRMVTSLAIPAVKEMFARIASIEAGLRQARIACAIQEYALSEKALPSSLDQLVPKYLDKIPRDVINGGPMHYRSDGKEYVFGRLAGMKRTMAARGRRMSGVRRRSSIGFGRAACLRRLPCPKSSRGRRNSR